MRPLGGRLDESEMLGSTPYTYYGGKGTRDALPHTEALALSGGQGRRANPQLLAAQGPLRPFSPRRTIMDTP